MSTTRDGGDVDPTSDLCDMHAAQLAHLLALAAHPAAGRTDDQLGRWARHLLRQVQSLCIDACGRRQA